MTQLKRGLTTYGLTMIAIGACIGSGIFLTPKHIAHHLHSPTAIVLVWVLGGIVALTGALTFAELGTLFPKSGGVYVFLKEAYGKVYAFLYGWVILLVVTSGAIAALSIAFAQYFDRIVPVGEGNTIYVALIAIIIVTVVNIFGVKIGELFSNVFTGAKLIGIAIIIGIGFFMTSGMDFQPDFSFSELSTGEAGGFALALIGVLWSYGGWHHASYLAGEAKNPQRTVPKAMIYGAGIVTITYVLTNIAYLYLMPVDEIAHSNAVAADAIGKIFESGGFLIAVLIAVSTFGTAGIYTLSAPRIYYAMAKDKVFFNHMAKVHPKYKTPVNAILLQSGWAIILLLFWQTFENLITYVVFMDWVFMTLAAIAIFIFRKRKIDNGPATYRTIGYPIVPLIFIGISVWFLINTLISKPEQALAGLVLLGLGLPLFLFFNKKLS